MTTNESSLRRAREANVAARRERIAAEMRQLKIDADAWNARHPDEEPIVIDMNLQPDIDALLAKREATKDLQAWSNGAEAFAARDEKHARDLCRTTLYAGDAVTGYTETLIDEMVENDGWEMLPDDSPMRDESGPTGHTVRDMIVDLGEPGHLWSVEQ